MRDHSNIATLRRVVGPERGQHSPRVVARAERELALRSGTEEAAFQRKLRLSGTICAVIGAFCVVWPVIMLTTFRSFGPADQPSDPNLPFMFRHFDQIFVAVGLLQAVVGAFLLSGGLLIRSRKPSGLRLVVAALSLVLFYIVAFTITFVPAAGFKGFPGPFAVMFFVFAILNGAVWAFALWFPLRFFRSPRVCEACSGAAV
jgi:hypothetical protein